jgi:porin
MTITTKKFSYVTRNAVLAAACALLSYAPLSLHAEDHLISALDDTRTALEERGVTIEAIATNDLVSNTHGGLKRQTGVLGNFDLTMSVDTEKAGMWDNGTFFFYLLGNYGKQPSSWTGDSQVTNNIETYSTAKLYEAWYEHAFMDDSLSVLAGLHDFNSEFDALDYAGNLINSSFGISPDISQVGPSIFATTALGLRVKYLPSDEHYVQAAVYDGVPGDPSRTVERGTRIRFAEGDGAFGAVEFGFTSKEGEPHAKLAFGGWYLSSTVESFDGDTVNDNYGGYVIGEHTLFSEEEGSEQGLGGFFQFGRAKPNRNQVGTYVGAGLMHTGLFPCRDEDALSLGVAYARNSSPYMATQEASDRAETALELNYRIEVLPYLALVPDLQFVLNPGTNPDVAHATVVGLRTEVAL